MVNIMKYTPILKWKEAEELSLRDLKNSQKESILPLMEFVRPNKARKVSGERKSTESVSDDELIKKYSSDIPQKILLSWGDGRPFFADFSLITPIRAKAGFSAGFFRKASKLHLDLIPVINISADTNDYIKHIVSLINEYSKHKICVRFSQADIERSSFLDSTLHTFRNESYFMPSDISILIDLKEEVSVKPFHKALEALCEIKSLEEYDNVIIASGAFPENMSEITVEDDRRPRTDWLNWLDNKGAYHGLSRYPAYADYTIRHPIYNELAMNRRATPTIKYTLPEEWWFFKGKLHEYDMFLANASVLRAHKEFFGREFSSGDKYIDDKGLYFPEYIREKNKNPNKKIDGPGNAKTWLRAGINHHIAVVVDQLANLDE